MTIKTERTEESAFGPAAVQTYERKSREYTITGTAKVPYDFGDEEVLTREDVMKMSQDREVMLAEIEQRYNDRKNSNSMNFSTPAPNNPVSQMGKSVPKGDFNF